MVVMFRTKSEAQDMFSKVKKMYKFAKEIKECFEDKMEDEEYDDEEYDDEVEYRSNYRSGGAQMRKGGRYGYRRM